LAAGVELKLREVEGEGDNEAVKGDRVSETAAGEKSLLCAARGRSVVRSGADMLVGAARMKAKYAARRVASNVSNATRG